MIFTPLQLRGAFLLEQERHTDERGFFARVWCQREFEAHGLDGRLVQASVAYNATAGTLRGMHYQAAPAQEAKLVRCTRGAIYDVIIDLRPASPTYLQWLGVELRAGDGRALYVPPDFAHGYLTLEDGTEVSYFMSEFYAPELGRGVRWDDPAVGIEWPAPVRVISARDRAWPDLPHAPAAHPANPEDASA
ncbi:MAG: dTDP-4-dehydrorhamnose 3,5-epimerase [Gemmatimonadetes bacterium]|nr:dTDP-4-dehydrorhamnose 3,5-epimerase [Gemmatimonadota bacterium]